MQPPPIPLKERRYQGFVGNVVFLTLTDRSLASSLANAVVGPLQEGSQRQFPVNVLGSPAARVQRTLIS